MPLYQIFHPESLWTTSQKASIASHITDLHCLLTGAPKFYVYVLFNSYPTSSFYVAGKETHNAVRVVANVRSGRSLLDRQELVLGIEKILRPLCLHDTLIEAQLIETEYEVGPLRVGLYYQLNGRHSHRTVK
jgi:phenylpyruvate tautomerase PptA (4-oxalocrotonate tautomerase family)